VNCVGELRQHGIAPGTAFDVPRDAIKRSPRQVAGGKRFEFRSDRTGGRCWPIAHGKSRIPTF
jgi:hypothetical protein